MSTDTSSSDRTPRGDAGENLKRIGKYQISKKLGVGGMGTVYLATDSDLKRVVALKVLPKDRASNPTLVRRFKSEGQAAALLHHKNIVSVYEAGQADGYLFLALEFVEGVDLLEWMNRRGPVPVQRSVEIMRQVADALQHAYERNIVHRDIKPSNLMISKDGAVKLTDMGLARSIDDTLDTTITRDGTTVGTVDYMAPEQASNSKAADIRSDIYSLGCTWYHMLTCQPPYPQGSVTNKLASHISGPIPDPRIINPKVPEAVVAIIHRMMAKKKEQRYQTPGELLEDLNSPGLKHGGGAPDLLAMLVEEGAAGVGRPGTAGPGGGSDSAFTVSKRPGGRATPGKGSSHQETRAEMASTDARAKLVRMDVGRSAGGDSGKNIPWGLIVLAGLVLAVIFTGMWISNTYAPAPPVQQPGSPYASGPDPNAVMRSNVPEPLPETPKPAPPPEPISGIPLPPGLAPPPNN